MKAGRKGKIAEEAIQRTTRGDKGSDLETERRDAEKEEEAGSGGRGTDARKILNKRVEKIFLCVDVTSHFPSNSAR